jgi:O-antigen biosynthesis protein WbqP
MRTARGYGYPGKRAIDVVLASVGLCVSAPFLVVCMIAVYAETGRPVIFTQRRVGRDEHEFDCHKLRTMRNGTGDQPSHEVSAAFVTRVGRFLRSTKLDELPQLWNVIRGEMSIVGPRPCLPSQQELIAARREYGLQKLRPGITGLAQVEGVDMSEPQRLAKLDAQYLQNMSLQSDIWLMARTVLGSGRGDRTNVSAN